MNSHVWAFAWVVFSAAILLAVVIPYLMANVFPWMDVRYATPDTPTIEELNANICDMRNIASTAVWWSLVFVVLGFVFYMVCFFACYKFHRM